MDLVKVGVGGLGGLVAALVLEVPKEAIIAAAGMDPLVTGVVGIGNLGIGLGAGIWAVKARDDFYKGLLGGVAVFQGLAGIMKLATAATRQRQVRTVYSPQGVTFRVESWPRAVRGFRESANPGPALLETGQQMERGSLRDGDTDISVMV